MHYVYPKLLNGFYDRFAFTEFEKESLESFKKRYIDIGSNLQIYEIGFEDYFIIHEILCRSEKNYYDKRHENREFLKRLFLDSINNMGRIQNIYKKFPFRLKSFFNNFDNIFTTNYDMNIEKFSEKEVYYLHGAFHVLDEIYNEKSLRNQLNDAPIKMTPVIEGYEYLQSNALTTYSGFSKLHNMMMNAQANIALSEVGDTYKNNKLYFESLNKSNVAFLRNLSEVVKIQAKNPNFTINEYYPIKEFNKIQGSIFIIGLSPLNDNHLFESINNSSNLQSVIYYYFGINEKEVVKREFRNLKLKFFDIRKLWKKYS